jgi:hypothetical protein
MERNLIIGAATGYNYNQLKPWVESIDEVCGIDVDRVLIVGDISQETRVKLVAKDFQLIDMPHMPGVPIHVGRFLAIYHYLKDTWQDYKFVVTTDVKDVYFQSNPFDWLEKIGFDSFKLVAGSESMKYEDEPWGNENLMQSYGPYVHEVFKQNEIYNVGTIGGQVEYVKDLMFNIFFNSVNRPIPIVDQAVYNVLLQTQPYKNVTYFATQSDGWACQAGTTADPSKMDQFRPHLLEAEPTFEDGLVLTGQDSDSPLVVSKKGTPFAIVHQYDRVPVWKKHVMEKYKQEDESTFFSYRTA